MWDSYNNTFHAIIVIDLTFWLLNLQLVQTNKLSHIVREDKEHLNTTYEIDNEIMADLAPHYRK